MKRMIVLLAVLLMAAPAMAAVTISGVDQGGGWVAISFSNDEATGKVRAMALDITADSGAMIVDVCDINTEYNIHPGSIEIEYGDPYVSGDGEILDEGSAICGSYYPGTEEGIDSNGVTLEMASLYETEPCAPNQSGLICRVQVTQDCTLKVRENTIRGGIVMEDPQAASGENLPVEITVVVGCPCKGELWNDAPMPNPITEQDVFYLIGMLNADADWAIWPSDAAWTSCADVTAPFGCIEPQDAFYMIQLVSAQNPRPCIP